MKLQPQPGGQIGLCAPWQPHVTTRQPHPSFSLFFLLPPRGKQFLEHFWPSSCPSWARQPSRILRPSAAPGSAPEAPILPSALQATPKEGGAEHQAGKSGSFPKLQAVFSAGWSCCTSHTVLMPRVWARDRFWRWALTMCKRLPCSVNLDQVNSCSRAHVMGTSTNR